MRKRESGIERDAFACFEKWAGIVRLNRILDLRRTMSNKK